MEPSVPSTFQWKFGDGVSSIKANPFRWSAAKPAAQIAQELEVVGRTIDDAHRPIVLKELWAAGGTAKQKFTSFREAVARLERSTGFVFPPEPELELQEEPEFPGAQGILARAVIRQGFMTKKGVVNPGWKRRWFMLDGKTGYLRYWEVSDSEADIRPSTNLLSPARAASLGEEKGHFDLRDLEDARIEQWTGRVLQGSREALSTLRFSRNRADDFTAIEQLTDVDRRSDTLVLRFKANDREPRELCCENQSDVAAWCYALRAAVRHFRSEPLPDAASENGNAIAVRSLQDSHASRPLFLGQGEPYISDAPLACQDDRWHSRRLPRNPPLPDVRWTWCDTGKGNENFSTEICRWLEAAWQCGAQTAACSDSGYVDMRDRRAMLRYEGTPESPSRVRWRVTRVQADEGRDDVDRRRRDPEPMDSRRPPNGMEPEPE